MHIFGWDSLTEEIKLVQFLDVMHCWNIFIHALFLEMYLVLPFHAKRSDAITVVINLIVCKYNFFFNKWNFLLVPGSYFLLFLFSSLHQRNCATHLMMELAHCKCACISDTLFYEFWRDIDVSCLGVFNLVSPNSLMQLLHDILNTMFNLLEWRNLEVNPFMAHIIW